MNNFEIPQRVHFVGIGGIGMSALAAHLLLRGVKVTGSDRTLGEETERLKRGGALIYEGHSAQNIGRAELVVATSAVKSDNIEISEAVRKGIPVVPREQLLGKIFDAYPYRIAVSGVHGKTTTTAMLDKILSECRVSRASFIGGVTEENSNYFDGYDVALAEACEFRESFRFLHPDILVALNLELDHPDFYKDIGAMEEAFERFFGNCAINGNIVVCADAFPEKLYINRSNAVTYGIDSGFYRAVNISDEKGDYSFDMLKDGKFLLSVKLAIPGKHNVYNALAALTVAEIMGLPMLEAAHALRRFSGTKRRWTEFKTESFDVVEDYAHHPTEIKAVVSTALSLGYRKVHAVFQPHTYSRTAAFFDAFSECFRGIDSVLYLPVYAAREKPIEGVSSDVLCGKAREKGINALYADTFAQAEDYVSKVADKKDLVLVLGAGDVYKIAEGLAKK